MKRLACIAETLIVLLALAAFATGQTTQTTQAPPTSPATSSSSGPQPPPAATSAPDPEALESNVGIHVEPFADYIRMTAGGNATGAGIRAPLTPRISAVYAQYQVPAAHTQFFLIEGEWRERLDHVLGKKAKALTFPASAVQLWVRAGLGTRRDDLGNNPAMAYALQAGLDMAIGQVGGGTLVLGFSGGFIGSGTGTAGGPKVFKFANSPDYSPELKIRF